MNWLLSFFRKPAPVAVEVSAHGGCGFDRHVAGSCKCFVDTNVQHEPGAGFLCQCIACDDYRRLRVRRWSAEFTQHQYDFVEYRRNKHHKNANVLLAEAQERRRKWLESLDETAYSEELGRATMIDPEIAIVTQVMEEVA